MKKVVSMVLMAMIVMVWGTNVLQVNAYPMTMYLELEQEEKPKQIIVNYRYKNDDEIYEYVISEQGNYVVVGKTDKKISTYIYNQDNQLLSCTECEITYKNGQMIMGEPKVTKLYIYNEEGRLVQDIDTYGVTAYFYEEDEKGNIKRKRITGSSWYLFVDDLEGKKFEQVVKDGIIYTYCYYENGELYRKLVMAYKEDENIKIYAKDEKDKLISSVYSSGNTKSIHKYMYNQKGKLEDEIISTDSGSQFRYHYEYDDKGNLLAEYMIWDEKEVGIDTVYVNTYDEQDRLIQVEAIMNGELMMKKRYIYN